MRHPQRMKVAQLVRRHGLGLGLVPVVAVVGALLATLLTAPDPQLVDAAGSDQPPGAAEQATPDATDRVAGEAGAETVGDAQGDVTPGLPVAGGDTVADDGDAADSSEPSSADGSEATIPPPVGGEGGTEPPTVAETPGASTYQDNLALVLASSVRNTNHDASPWLLVPSADLDPANHYGPRDDYLGNPAGNPEGSFPVPQGGQFRTGCEFSHFAYDDPLVFPGQPGVSHLHMFFGNTHVNAHSTYETLIDSGSSTCNGQELNRTGYWVPAMFDGEGNIRIPERVVVYYKGEGLSRGASVVYPPEAAMVSTDDINAIGYGQGGAEGKFSFVCSDQYSGASSPASNTIPDCDGSRFYNESGVTDNPHVVLEMNVKFPQCWTGGDPADWANSFRIPSVGGWYYSDCQDGTNLPNLEYFVNYRVDVGESTADWYLSSDVDPGTHRRNVPGGTTVHGDWWGGWHEQTNQLWIDNCVNYATGSPSGCGFGYLSDGGPNPGAPYDGPALQYRPQYTGPHRIPASVIFAELCSPLTDRSYTTPESAAHCLGPPAGGVERTATGPAGTGRHSLFCAV